MTEYSLQGLLEQPHLINSGRNYFKITRSLIHSNSGRLSSKASYLEISGSKVVFKGKESQVVFFQQIDDIIKSRSTALRTHY